MTSRAAAPTFSPQALGAWDLGFSWDLDFGIGISEDSAFRFLAFRFSPELLLLINDFSADRRTRIAPGSAQTQHLLGAHRGGDCGVVHCFRVPGDERRRGTR